MNQNLNEAQRQAVLHTDGPMMVLAGPGSGKTFVITRRIENLIRHAGADPSEILVITFTKAAAKQMQERFLSQGPPEGRHVAFGTFHAVFFMMLKHAYRLDAASIIREDEKMRLMRQLLRGVQTETEDEAGFLKDVLSEISLVKNGRIDIGSYEPQSCGREIFEPLFTGYRKHLKSRRKIDFDDMLVHTYELFLRREDVLKAWQDKYRYILIDEFQDVNRLQYDIVRMLAAPRQNLFIVGDDDQSIYRFRGAKPEIMLHMPDDYPDAKIVCLSYNYRCPKAVVNMANRLISHNKERFAKEIIAAGKEEGEITAEVFDTQRQEHLAVAERIRRGEAALSQTAVLFRTNTQAGMLMECLMEYNIPFLARDVLPNLYEHWIAQDFYAYLRLAKGTMRRQDALLVMNRPVRYLSRESLENETVDFLAWKAFYADQPWMQERIDALREDLLALRQMRPFAAVNYIRKAIGYDAFLSEYAKSRHLKEESLFEIADALQEASRPYASEEEWHAHIRRYQERLKEASRQAKQEQEAVTLATFHGAKGLEFDAVHILDINEEITPYKKAVLPAEIEEERRMFYVGLTRAKKALHLYACRKLRNKDAQLSRFWTEAGAAF